MYMCIFVYIHIQYVIRELYICVCVCVCVLGLSGVSSSETPWIVALQGPMSMRFFGQELGCHLLLQGIFLTQEENLSLLHCR